MSLIIWIVNTRVVRFADDQSVEMLILSVATSTIIQSDIKNAWLLFSFWILASPVLKHTSLSRDKLVAIVPILRPFDIKPLLVEMERFLSCVKPNQRILMAFDDPQEQYNRIFDGYRVLLEVPLYVASKKEFHFMPDWWAVSELNYEGAPDVWGREVPDVLRQMKTWEADYVVVYQTDGAPLEEKWAEAGFKVLGLFSWSAYEKEFGITQAYSGPAPDWWLLARNS
jgi:hypothetical protein